MSENEAQAMLAYDETLHIAFATEAEALAFDAGYSAAAGFGQGVTQRWDVPRQCADGRWIVARPPGYTDPVQEPAQEGSDDMTRRDLLGLGGG